MANATTNLIRTTVGKEGGHDLVDVTSGVRIFEGTMVAVNTTTGKLVVGTTAGSGRCIGVASHEVNDTAATGLKSCMVEYDRIFVFPNGVAADAIAATAVRGATLYMVDDNTVSTNSATGTRQLAGTFQGFEPDGRVRVYIAADYNAALAS